jgi:cell division protein FtsB
MRYSKRSSWKKYLASPIALVLLLIAFGILVRATWNLSSKATAGSARLAQAQTEFGKLEQRKNDLAGKVGKLSSDEGLEAEIRTKYRAVKEGESVAVIIDNEKAAAIEATTTVQIGFWAKLLHKLGLSK